MDKLTKEALELIESGDRLITRAFIYNDIEHVKNLLRKIAETNPRGVIEMLTGGDDDK